jgi:serine/threonine protein phosphatase PrpC
VTIRWKALGATHVGRRRRGNEDSYHTDLARGIFLVADGMGGHAAGEIASELVSTTVAHALAEARDAGTTGDELIPVLQQASHAAHDAIVHCCDDDDRYNGMGTTLTACVVDPSGRFWIGHIGDSRLYRLRGGRLEQLTHDHTWVQREIDEGRLTATVAGKHPLSHILTRVLSEDSDPDIDLVSDTVEPGDLLLLVTDGLYNMLDDARIAELASADAPLPDVATSLIRAANRAGGADNITVVLVQIE